MKFLSLILLFAALPLAAQNATTHTYFQDLQLDLFAAAEPSGSLVIYVHGGGFSGGNRSEGNDYCTFLQANGIDCATITYTLYMKGRTQDWGCDGILSEKLKTLQLSANEIWAATTYLSGENSPLSKAPTHIYLAGASAGAEAVLHAGFYDRAEMSMIEHQLEGDFQYAGVISGAGALVDANLITKDHRTPLLLFHGTNDPLVPYGTAPHHFCNPDQSGWMMLFGAASLADRMDDLGGSYTLITHVDGGHELAGWYFHKEYERSLYFLQQTRMNQTFQNRHTLTK